MKFIYSSSEESNLHWQQCEKERAPFITLSKVSHDFVNIFYDITNYRIDLETISNDIKKIYTSYIEFFMLPTYVADHMKSQHYLFDLVVKSEHAEIIAEQLYDYLLNRLKT